MTQREKLFEKMRNNQNNVSFEDLKKLLEMNGYEQRKQTSGTSHFWFYK